MTGVFELTLDFCTIEAINLNFTLRQRNKIQFVLNLMLIQDNYLQG